MRMRRVLALSALLAALLPGCASLPDRFFGKEEIAEGERIPLLPEEKRIQADPDAESVPFTIPSQQTLTSWPRTAVTFGDRPDHIALGERLERLYAETLDVDNDSGLYYIPPMIVMDRMYALGADGTLSAYGGKRFDKRLWKRRLAEGKEGGSYRFGGMAIYKGAIYVSSGGTSVASVRAADGELLWRKELSGVARGALAVYGSLVYVNTLSNRLYALDIATGDVRWSHEAPEQDLGYVGTAAPTVYKDLAMAAYSSGDVYVLQADTGNPVWNKNVTPSAFSGERPVSDVGISPQAYAGYVILASHSGHLSLNDLRSGVAVWKMEIKAETVPWAAAEYLYGMAEGNVLFAVHIPTAKVRWTRKLALYERPDSKKGRISYSAPVLAGGKLFLASDRGKLLSVSPSDGKIVKSYDIPEGVTHAPIVVSERLYVMNGEGKLAAFGEE